ncbi:MAG: alpha/beta fold hydrolase [Roseicyclus sp.]|uniref:alpha/beta fold hydrolase n=1 Tax=Roseicyclus sp. TaxID=1914329 RepID=UPI003A8575F5
MGIEPGDDRPWILLPGTLCTGAVFDPFLDALGVPAGSRHVIELGQPEIADYLAPLLALSHDRAVICGFSLGAIVAAHLVDCLPAAQCLFFGLNPRPDDPVKRQGRLDLAADVDRLGGIAALESRLPSLAGPDPDGGRARILAMAGLAARHVHAQTRLALERPGAFHALSRAGMPITLLTGTRDEQAPLTLAQEAVAAAPMAKLAPLEGLGHYALVEDPRACADAVRLADDGQYATGGLGRLS